MHRIVTIILLSLVCLGAIAKDYDFSAKSNGTEIYYKINDDNKTVSIVPKKKYKESPVG